MTTAMLAARFTGDAGVEVVECARPVPGPDEVLVRVLGCGICASNLPLWQGRPWFDYPRTPGEGGHEAWGVVEECGAGATHVAPGTRVAVLSERAYAQFDVAPVGGLAPLPAGWGDAPAPGEPLGCAVNVFRRSSIRAGQHVAVVGLGFLGDLLVQLAVRAGARVIAVSRQPFARERALRHGAALALAFDDGADRIVAAVHDLTRGRGCGRVLEVTGKQAPLQLAERLVAVRGRLVIAGYHQDGRREVDLQRWNWQGIDVVNAHERSLSRRAAGMRQALRLCAEGAIDPLPLYTARVGLGELAAGLAATADRPRDFYKALVEVRS